MGPQPWRSDKGIRSVSAYDLPPMTAQTAFVLHSRPYRESSALVDFFTPEGRLRAVLRGACGKAGTLARPFVPLEVEFRGRGELKSVGRLEGAGLAYWLDGN